jgi:hypothetical protein
MKKRLTIAVVGAALAATLSFVAAGSSGREPVAAQSTSPSPRILTIFRAYAPNDQRGPRIIHVPQAGERDERASVDDRDDAAVSKEDDDGEAAPSPRRRIMPAPQRHSDTPPHPRAPRWQPRTETPPPPSEPRRAVLSAPPPPAEGPTPLRPTPRFSTKADPADKFSQPRDARSNASPPPPPAGYTPPTAIPQED